MVTVTDQSLKQRRSVTNALGHLIRVDEPTDTGGLGAIDTPNQPTNYTYDTLNNLTTVNQGIQTRSFSYNSLSRLLSATNPESGTISYSYDNNGNLTTKTDARLVVTNYIYDALNRVTNRNYTAPNGLPNYQATPNVDYFYDNLPNAKGKLTKVNSSVSTTEYTSFDILGRVMGHKQTTDGNAYTTRYTYKLSGALDEETYPSTRVVKNVLDNNGNLSIVESKKNANSGFFNYAKNFTYNAAGAATSLQLGNGKWESTQFNSRLQPIQIALGTVQNGTDKLKLNYDYGTTADNGNVLSQIITVPNFGAGQGFTASQTYTYDSLNRLKDASEIIGTQTWRQAFLYDRYGNRNFDIAYTTTLGSCPTAQCNPTINAANNRFNSGQGYSYDLSGNTTVDAEARSFIYDAESKQTSVSGPGGTVGQYWYDGDGKRVKKYVPSTGETTIFVYDAAGKQIAEYSTIVYVGTDAKVAYTTSDHLGSPRINTDSNGAVIARHDYMPFGEELTTSITSQRASTVNYGDDSIRKQFTGYERDGESGLDYTGARYYSKVLGRFLSVDPIVINLSRRIDPQRINGYGYVRNNPLKYVDPDGMDLKLAVGLKKSDQDRIIKNAIKLYRKESGRKALDKLESSKTTYEMRSGPLPTKSSDVGTIENYGLTKPDNMSGTKDDKTGKITSIDKDNVTVGITLDFGKFDQTQRDILNDKRPVGSLPSENGVFNHEIGHADDFENDPVRQQNQAEAEDEKSANGFAEKIRKEKDSLSEDEAEKRVREIYGLPSRESKGNSKDPKKKKIEE